jgi:hypothetical protein
MSNATYTKAMHAAEKLDPDDLERFVEDVLALSARRRAPVLSQAESDLLLTINRPLPAELGERSAQLREKLRAGRLSDAEQAEALRIGDEIEKLQVERTAALVELARLRGQTLPQLMAELGIQAPPYV